MPDILPSGYIGTDSIIYKNIKQLHILVLVIYILMFVFNIALLIKYNKHENMIEAIDNALQKNNITIT